MTKFKDVLEDFVVESGEKSLRKLSSKIGIAHSQMSKYLKGVMPKPATAIKLANYFKCSLDYLFGLDANFKEISKTRYLDASNFYPKYDKLLRINKITHNALAKIIDINATSLNIIKRG